MTKIVFLPPLEIGTWRYYQFIIISYPIYIIHKARILKHSKQQKKHTIIVLKI